MTFLRKTHRREKDIVDNIRRGRKDLGEKWLLSKCRGVAAGVIKVMWVRDVSNLEEAFNCTEFAVEKTRDG